ncbi:hypothetical protein RJ640_010654 [Escallonia rubra]|uniref:DUF761 domain-containing protein n=1 Tax=Escallonia rubra TaxID=112253 RepID=A0AA88R1F4_9ASTE|nr:hypothetical protein RJ640_010654 [Escallonia rubra]
MVGPSNLKTLNSLHVFPMKYSPSPSPSPPPSTLTSMKLKTLIHTFIFSHLCRVARAVTKAKSILVEVLKEIHLMQFIEPMKKSKNKKLFFGSFRLHYNWCSSHVMPVPSPVYYDSTWNSFISAECGDMEEAQLSGYLNWLEQKVHGDSTTEEINEIDQLADMFIANCHEKFRLEKVESYRRFQEMMARSV